MNGKSLIGVICILVGGLLALKFLSINLSAIFAFFLPIILIVCGFIGLRNGQKVIGSVFIIIGFVMLLGKLGGFMTLIFSIALIGAGIFFIMKKSRHHY